MLPSGRQIQQRFIKATQPDTVKAPHADVAKAMVDYNKRRENSGSGSGSHGSRPESRRLTRQASGSGGASRENSTENRPGSYGRTQSSAESRPALPMRPESRHDEHARLREENRKLQEELSNLREFAERQKAKDVGEIQMLKEGLQQEQNQRSNDRHVLEEKIRILVDDNNRLKQRTLTLERSLEDARSECSLERSKRSALEAASSISRVNPTQFEESEVEPQKVKQLKDEIDSRESAMATLVSQLQTKQAELERLRLIQQETQRRNDDLTNALCTLHRQLEDEKAKVTLQRAYFVRLKENPDSIHSLPTDSGEGEGEDEEPSSEIL